tara:strand:+ start:248 stop:769 length:522 start_codon:yes stop_codon:yes gene_type:complete
MFKFKSFFFIILFFTYFNIVFSETIKYLSINEIMNNSIAGKDIIAQLNKDNKILTTSFKNQEDKFKKDEAIIISQKNILEKNELDKKVKFLKKEINKYNKNKILQLKNLEAKKIKAQTKLINLINKIMIDYMDKNSISFVLKKESIFVGKKELDISSEILSIINKQVTKIIIE